MLNLCQVDQKYLIFARFLDKIVKKRTSEFYETPPPPYQNHVRKCPVFGDPLPPP